MAYLTIHAYNVVPRVSADQGFIRIRMGDHNTVGLTRVEAVALAADILHALQVTSFETIVLDAVDGAA